MKKKTLFTLWIFSFVIVCLSIMFFILFNNYPEDKVTLNSIGGFYNGRSIVLYPARSVSYNDYMVSASHEWAHYYYDKLSYKGFLVEWNRAIQNCSIETEYAQKYHTYSIRFQEEYAECFSKGGCCEKKMSIIKKIKG